MTADESTIRRCFPTERASFALDNLTSQTVDATTLSHVRVRRAERSTPAERHWKTTRDGMERLAERERLHRGREHARATCGTSTTFRSCRSPTSGTDTRPGGFADDKLYVVQTAAKVVERCLLMTTDPGDLVLDPTCGSGTTATSPSSGAGAGSRSTRRASRSRSRGSGCSPRPSRTTSSRTPTAGRGGFVYKRRQNKKGEEVGGIVPHVTLKSIANDEPPPRRCSSTGRRSTRRSRASPARSSSRRRSRRRSTSTATAIEDSGVPEDAVVRRPDARGAAPQPVAPARREQDDRRCRTSGRRRSR